VGETLAGCTIREVKEETGLDVEVTGIVGIYTDPKHVFAYDHGEVRQEFSTPGPSGRPGRGGPIICVSTRIAWGTIAVSDESVEVAFHDPEHVANLPMVNSIPPRVTDHLSGQTPAIR
jgi:8-oxo-dGTP pyrophosphatase MutT (NUDIX family)